MTKLIEYNMHPKQGDFLQATKQHILTGLITGQNFGKTTVGMLASLYVSQKYVCDGMIVAPTYGMFSQVIMPTFDKIIPKGWIVDSNKTEGWVQFKNGSKIWLRSGDDPSKLDGSNLHWAWIDEAKLYKTDEIFRIVRGRIGRDNRVPIEHQDGHMWITSTPIGIHHWLYRLFVDNPPPSTTYISGSTKENIFMSKGYYDNLKATYTGIYAEQQLEGKFVSFEGLVYDTFSLTENVADVERNPNNPLYIGIDDGYAHGGGVGTISYHPRVILFVERQPNGGFHILDEYVVTSELPEVSLANAFTMYPKADIMGAYIDSSASDLIRRVGDLGISYMRATHSVADGIKTVRRYMLDGQGQRLIKINPRCKNLIRELQTYRYADTSKSEAGEIAPLKMDDHSADAMRYVIFQLGKFT